MPTPTYDRFIEPLLRVLEAEPEASEVYDRVAGSFGLTDEERSELLPSGKQLLDLIGQAPAEFFEDA